MPRRSERLALALLLAAGAAGAQPLAAAPGAAEAAGEAAEAAVTVTVTLASDYAWRGLSLSRRRPSLQLDVALTRAVGAGLSLEGGAWAYSTGYADDPDVHADTGMYARLAGPTGLGSLGWSLQAARYHFPQARGWNYTEWTAAIDRPAGEAAGSVGFELAYSHAPDAFGTGGRGRYLQADVTVRLPRDLALRLHAGRSRYARPELAYPAFSDARVALAAAVAGFDMEVGRVATRGGSFGRMGAGRWVISVSRSF